MRTILRHLFTGKDGSTFDVARVGFAVALLSYVGISGWHTVHSGAFDPQAWAFGATALLTGGAAGVKIKETTEPPGGNP